MSSEQLEQLGDGVAERIADGRLRVPVLPAVASAVLGVINDPDADIGDLATTIRNDQALAAHVTKYANSPLLRTGAPIVSLEQAITRLGMRSVADVAFAACMGPKLFKAPLYAPLIDRLWQESLATAMWTREIALARRRDVEPSFLCGLLHQIGRPVVLQALQDIIGPGPVQPPSAATVDALLARHGVQAGLEVGQRWNLPAPIVETIAHVDHFYTATTNPGLIAKVAAARVFAGLTVQEGVAAEAAMLLPNPAVVAAELDADGVGALLARLPLVRESLNSAIR